MSTLPKASQGAEQEPVTLYHFESITLTENYCLKTVGTRYRDTVTEEFTISANQPPHPDLLRVLRKLTLHLVLLTEQLDAFALYPEAAALVGLVPSSRALERELALGVESGEVYEHELLETFRCTGVKFAGKGPVLLGERKSKYRTFGKSLELKTPPIIDLHLEEDEEGAYPFFDQLRHSLDELRAEAQLYVQGKYGAGGEQLLLFGKAAPEKPAHPMQGILEGLTGVGSITISDSSGRGVTLEKGKAPRSFRGKVLDDE